MTTTPHGQVPEALIDLIDAYAESRHRCGGGIYNAMTEAARKAVIEALSGMQALSAAPEAIAKLRHLYQNMVTGAVRDTASAKRIAEGLLAPAIEALERATPPAEQQATKETSGGFHVWRDISTAPKDGSRFVATGHNYGLYSEVRHTCVAQWFRGCWMEASDWNETSELKYLTHWMPLPSPPDDVAAPAEQQAQPGAVYAELHEPDATTVGLGAVWNRHSMRDFADRTHALRQQATPKAAPVVWLSSKQLRGVTALHGQYLPFRCQPEGRFDTPVYLVEAAPKTAPGEQDDHQILAITTAYEQGVGKGHQAYNSGKEIANPYSPAYRCDLAWQYGYKEGKEQAQREAKAAPQQEAQEPVATLHCDDIGYVWAWVTEVGTRMRFEQPINLYTAPQPAPAPLSDAIKHYLEAQDALDNREYAGINAESYEKLIRCRNASRKDLDAALAAQGGKV